LQSTPLWNFTKNVFCFSLLVVQEPEKKDEHIVDRNPDVRACQDILFWIMNAGWKKGRRREKRESGRDVFAKTFHLEPFSKKNSENPLLINNI